jgi:farnesyl-diphosphate farnesyltransferase
MSTTPETHAIPASPAAAIQQVDARLGPMAPPAEVELPAAADDASAPEEIDRLLERTSRTFALAIPLLPEPTRQQVGIAYLLFRVADTFEDAELWPRDRKLEALDRFARLLQSPAPEEARRAAEIWLAAPPCSDAGYLELLRRTPQVLGAFWRLSPGPRQLIGEHTRRTAEGMARFVRRAAEGGEIELADLEDLRGYCYVVAGIVGEMLTELFLSGRQALAPVRRFLRARSARFGEALQLVNIIKDSLADAAHGRRFLPAAGDLSQIVELARRDLRAAARYTLSLQGAGAPSSAAPTSRASSRPSSARSTRGCRRSERRAATRPRLQASSSR